MKKLAITIAAAIIALLCARSALLYLTTGRLFAPTTSEFVALARKNQYIVQAAYDYRAERGMWPQDFADLIPDYLTERPAGPLTVLGNQTLSVHADAPHTGLCYSFRAGEEGWSAVGDFGAGPLPMPTVASTRPAVTGDALVRARLAEYDRRIARDRPDAAHFVRLNYARKVAYLVSLGRQADALDACRAACRAVPDWWRPQMLAAVLAPPDEAPRAQAEFRAWVAAHPTFIHYWYLCRFYRDRGRHDEAVAALRQGVTQSLADADPDGEWVPDAHAFDAAGYACQRGQPELVLQVAALWEQPREVYTYHNDNLHAFRAAAELALGRPDEAKADLDAVVAAGKSHGLWAGNLDRLARAVAAQDRTFVYDPGKLPSDWTLLQTGPE